jgi:CRP/FNR family transcriptional regulator, nitrogen fixation regulation protein
LPGDFFGFECVDEHTVSAEAVTNAKVLVIKKTILAAVASRDAAIEHQLLLLMTGELARLQERVFLPLKHAQERVGEFIFDMEKRASVGNSIELQGYDRLFHTAASGDLHRPQRPMPLSKAICTACSKAR